MKIKTFLFLLVGLFLLSFASAGIDYGLKSYYYMNQTSGNLLDALGVNNLTKFGTIGYSMQGIQNLGMSSVGSGASPSANRFQEAFTGLTAGNNTIAFWFKRNVNGTNADFSFYSNSLPPSNQAGMNIRITGGTLYCGVSDSAYFGNANIPFNANDTSWHFVSCVYGRTANQIELWYDGFNRANSSWDGRSLIENQTITLFADNTGATYNSNYSMDEVGIWNRSLTISELNILWNTGMGNTFPFSATPVITLTSPTNNTQFLIGQTTNFTWTSEETISSSLSNTTLYIDGILNQTFSISGGSNITTINKILGLGNHTFVIQTCATASCVNTTNMLKVIEVVNTSLSYPTDGLVTTTNPLTLVWNSNATTIIGLINTTLYIDGILNETITISGSSNVTTSTKTFSVGNHSWVVRSCVSTNCSNSTARNFNITNYIINSQSYNNITQETLTELFSINISLASGYSIDSAYLFYNGTPYSSSTFSNGNYRIVNASVIIPNVTSQQNVSFFWSLNINSVNYNTTSNNQTINSLALDGCLVNTFLILNYTIRDEDNRTIIPHSQNLTSNVYVKLTGDLTGGIFEYVAQTTINNTIPICVNTTLLTGQNYKLDAEIQFTANNYVKEYHYIDNYTLNLSSSPKNVSLYLLASANSQEFLITYKNSFLLPVEGAFIELTRQYLNIPGFLSVEISQTDADGRTIQHFVLNDEVYTIYVWKNGELLATFENVRAFCDDLVTGDCKINLNELSSTSNPDNFQSTLGLTTSSTYNKTTKLYQVEFTSLDGANHNVTLHILKYAPQLNETICLTSLTSSSGTLSCTIPASFYNSTAVVKLFVDGVQGYSNFLIIDEGIGDTSNSGRYILAFLLMLTLPLLGLSSGVMTLVLFFIGFITAGALNLIETGGVFGVASSILWIAVGLLIVAFKSSKKREQI